MEKTFDDRVREYTEKGMTLIDAIWKVNDEDWATLFSDIENIRPKSKDSEAQNDVTAKPK